MINDIVLVYLWLFWYWNIDDISYRWCL